MILFDRFSFNRLKLFVILVVLVGIIYRCTNLDLKPYWHDETFTSLRISGYNSEELIRDLFQGQVVPVSAFDRYQQPSPDRTLFNTIDTLAKEVPEHPPLFYGLERCWAQLFGGSVAAMRSLPLLMSLLGFPAIYGLCLELFKSARTGWVAMALFAVSPIYLRYAQEARQYSLWILLILLSSWALLRAIRLGTRNRWGGYAIAVAAGFYCHLFSSLVFLGQGIYVLAIARFRLTKAVLSYAIASALGFLAFLPWFWVILVHKQKLVETTNWTKNTLPLSDLIHAWQISLCRAVVAWHPQFDRGLIYLSLPILVLVMFSFHHLYSRTPMSVWLFIILLMSVTVLPLVLPDLIWGGQRSMGERYLLPCYLAIHLAVANCLSQQIAHPNLNRRQIGSAIATLVIYSSIISGAFSSQASTWWGWSEFDVKIPRIINQTSNVLVISDLPLGAIMPLSYRLDRDIKLLLLSEPEKLEIPPNFKNIYAYHPSDRLQAAMKARSYTSQLVYQFQDKSLVLSLYRYQLNL
jgi:uncharacterized membrane protein